MSTIQQVLEYAAAKNGVDIDLAFAVAWNESSLNPKAVGDDGTSFGLYQLHKGGELGALTEETAFDPLTNADVALAEFKAVKEATPDLVGGTLAAAAQRPAEPAAYASRVDVILQAIKVNQMPDSYGRALAADAGVELPAAPAPVEEPAPVTDIPIEPTTTEAGRVEDAVAAQAKVVDADAVAGKVGALRAVIAELETHLSELENLIK